jgi:uncharacterized coiled-coil protein SlyX
MPYDGSLSELDDDRRKTTAHSFLSLHIGDCSRCLEHLKHLEDSTLAFSQTPTKSKAPLSGRRTFQNGIRVGQRFQLAEDRIIMEEHRRKLHLLKEKILKGRNQMLADIVTKFAVFQTELDDICAMADMGRGSSGKQESLSEEYVSISYSTFCPVYL